MVIESCARPLVTGSMTVADVSRFLFRVLEKLSPVQPHEWPKAFLLFCVATLWGMSTSISRAASEGLFLSHLGVEYLPTLLLANPLLVLILSMVYSAYADRLARPTDDRGRRAPRTPYRPTPRAQSTSGRLSWKIRRYRSKFSVPSRPAYGGSMSRVTRE
jgi:hypothetical protein